MNITKKIIATIVGLSMVLTIVPVDLAQGQTIAELQAQIAALIAQVAALQAKLAVLEPAVPVVAVPAACKDITFERNLRVGISGADVRCLQALLNTDAATRVAATGPGSPGNETSTFGPRTRAAVIKFQGKYAAEILTPVGLTVGTGFVGASTRAKLNALLVAPPVVAPPVVAPPVVEPPVVAPPVVVPLSVALNVNTPPVGNVFADEANRVVTKVDFAASAETDTNITSLTVKSFGTAGLAAQDIANVKIFDGTRQVGLTQSLVAGRTTFIFTPAITIPKGTVKTLDIAVTITTGAGVMRTVRMGIESAGDVGGATFTGVFPVIGNTFNILPAAALGTLSATAGVIVPVTAAHVGARDVVLGNFIVSAGPNEDIDVTQFNVSYRTETITSPVLDADVVNVRIRVDGALQGSASNFAMRRATVDFVPAIRITKGTSRSFQVIGDIAGGVGRNIELRVEAGAVFARGVTTGVGLSGPGAAFNLETANRIEIGRGALVVAVSPASPTGAAASIVKSTVSQTLGVYDLRAIGEDILVNTVRMTIGGQAGAAGSITSVGLYNEAGALLSNLEELLATEWVAPPVIQTFTLNWSVPAGTTQRLFVRGITHGIAGPVPAASITATLGGTGAIVATGMRSSGIEGPNNISVISTLALPTIRVYQGPTFTLAGDPLVTPRNQAILSPISMATVASVRLTAARENQEIRRLVLRGVPTGTAAAFVSGVALFDGPTQVTNFVAPVGDNVTFEGVNIIEPIRFTVGAPKTLRIVANVLSGVTIALHWTVPAGDLTTVGLVSGMTATTTVADLRVTSPGLGLNSGGEVTAHPDVLEIKRAVGSPTGDVPRATFGTMATWELDARGTASLDITAITFTSRTGLAGATTTDTGLVRLFDEDTGAVIAVTATIIDPAAGTITFTIPAGNLRVTHGITKRISLQMTTTDTTKFPAGSSLHFTVNIAGHVTVVAVSPAVGARGAGFGGTVWSIPADANRVTIR